MCYKSENLPGATSEVSHIRNQLRLPKFLVVQPLKLPIQAVVVQAAQQLHVLPGSSEEASLWIGREKTLLAIPPSQHLHPSSSPSRQGNKNEPSWRVLSPRSHQNPEEEVLSICVEMLFLRCLLWQLKRTINLLLQTTIGAPI